MRVLYLLAFLLFVITLHAQTGQSLITSPAPFAQQPANNPPGCVTDLLHNLKMANNPAYAQQQQLMDNAIRNFAGAQRGGTITIPVVIHIVHNNGPENISDQQVLDGLFHLNLAFANISPYNTSNGVNTGIQFCLAQQDPNGEYTTGITRTVSTLTNMNAESEDLQLKNLIRWDPTRYLNIWLVKEITTFSMGSGVAGYAYFPSSHGQPEDGIVNEASLFGSSINNSKVHIHEAGHYLGLYHTFEGGCTNNNCQTDGDRVCDTPPDNSTNAVLCAENPNTCTSDDDDLSTNNPFRPVANGGLGDQPDMFENYMDYGFQFCQNAFSQGQSTRMNLALNTSRASLLQSIGCNSICYSPINTSYTTSATTILYGGSVTFTVTSPSNGITYTWAVNGVPFGTGTSVSRTFSNVGTYTITLTADNGQPACLATETFDIRVNCNAQASFNLTPAGPYSPGATITATSTSTNATNYAWYVDGVFQSNSTSISRTFNTAGGHNISLIAGNSGCADTSSTVFFEIGDCSLDKMNANWVIQHKRINFNPPSIGQGGSPMSSWMQECTSSISDVDGNLQIFSDGITVWDSGFNIIGNGTGLTGHYSTTQGVLITPYPGDANKYYVFTTDATENNDGANGFRYNVVDMTLNSGQAAIIADKKNILIRNSVGEKLTGTFHANGNDIWVSVADQNATRYLTYLITPAGLDTTPVVSYMGTINNQMLGALKFSPDGNKVAACVVGGFTRAIVIADFNKATGQITNGFEMIMVAEPSGFLPQPYSLEFSPDNSKLYVSHWNINQVWQYNLAAGSNAAIQASKTRVDTYGNASVFGQLSAAINGKIYIYAGSSGALDVINSPNLAGAACNYTTGAISFPPTLGSIGLQNIVTGLEQPHNPDIAGPALLCIDGVPHTYTIPYATSTDVAAWTYTGPGTMVNNNNNTVSITTNTAGSGMLSVVLTGACGITYDTLQITTVVPQQVSLGPNRSFCNSINLFAQQPFTSYLWSNSSTNDTITITAAGSYWLRAVDNNGCASRDTVTLITNPPAPILNITQTGLLCTDGVVVLTATPGFDEYEWQNGFPEQTFTAFSPGTYWITARSGCNVQVDSITLQTSAINFNLTYNGDTLLCNPQLPITLTAPQGYTNYLWQNGNQTTNLQVNAPGKYWLTVTNAGGCAGTDTFWVGTNPPDFQLTINGDETPCGISLPAIILGPLNYESYLWENGANGYINVALVPGTHWLTVYNQAGCSATDSIFVNSGGSSTPINLAYNGDTIVCADDLPFTLNAPQGYTSYLWQDGSSNNSFVVNTPGTYWVSVSDSCGSGSDTLVVRTALNFELTLNGDTIACKNVLPFTLNAPTGYQQYFWQNGNASQSINISSVGTYWLRVTDSNGCTGIDTFRVVDCTNIDELAVSPVKLYPNPANNMLNIDVDKNTPIQLWLIDITGQVLLNQQFTGNSSFSTAAFASGVYLVRVNANNRVWHQKLIITH
jgi:hypothetical protein